MSRLKHPHVFIIIFLAIIIAYILVDFWKEFIDVFMYKTLGFNKKSALTKFLVALIATVVFIAVLLYLDKKYGMEKPLSRGVTDSIDMNLADIEGKLLGEENEKENKSD
jgi:uncharacterized membrane protein YedE/YeeE